MSHPKPFLALTTLLLLLIFVQHLNPNVAAQNDDHSNLQDTSETLIGWPSNITLFDLELDIEVGGGGGGEADHGRSLLNYYYGSSSRPRRRYYNSYGALSANRIPFPPRSGRSYYTHNCYKIGRPVNPYSRGCSTITRCRR